MKRKLIRQGKSALTVTLPTKWAEKLALKPGDEIEVEEKDSRLELSAKKEPELLKTEIDTTALGHFNKVFLNYLYKAGYDEILFKFDNIEVFKQIQERVSMLIGYAIVDQKENSCLVKCVSETKPEDFDIMLRKTLLVMVDMSESIIDVIKKEQHNRLKEIRALEGTNNTFTDFCMRSIKKWGYKEPKTSLFIYCILRDLEKLGDIYKYICDYLYNNKTKLSGKTIEVFEFTNDYLRKFYELFYRFDSKKAKYLNDKRYEKVIELNKLMENVPKKEILVIHYLANIIILIYEFLGPYYEMTI